MFLVAVLSSTTQSSGGTSGTQDWKAINSATVSLPTITVETNTDGVQTIRVVATNFVYASTINHTQLATLLQEGKFLYESGRYDEAADKFKEASAIGPDNLPSSQYLHLVAEKLQPSRKPIKLEADFAGTTSSSETTSNVLTTATGTMLPEVEIKAWFVEIRMKEGETNSYATHTNARAITGILTAAQFRQTLEALQNRDGTDVLQLPSVITESGRQAQMQIGDMQTIVLPGKGPNTAATSEFFVGETLDTFATVSADKKSIDFELVPSITKFLGYDSSPAVPVVDYVSKDGTTTSKLSGPMSPNFVPLPHFRLRQFKVNVTAWDGQTVVISGFTTDVPVPDAKPFQTVKKNLIIFVTATLLNPDGSVYHSEEETKALWAGPPPQSDSTNQ